MITTKIYLVYNILQTVTYVTHNFWKLLAVKHANPL